ncbi:ABC transporter ATP-binding protein/permease [Escherichia coli]|uniref:ABC transporter ATP-binding protein/permease n=1 Tax=Escherichia coli TaxID=562 RepID=A0A376TI11_ECOLX|nr:ABC transporter ATP-binding protein/permease [Escherichia coli]
MVKLKLKVFVLLRKISANGQWKCYGWRFLSSGILEFFTSLSIALVAVYFGFSYLGELDFGHYDTGVTLAAGFLALILAPEFFPAIARSRYVLSC